MSACYTPAPPTSGRKLNWAKYNFADFNLHVHDTIGDGHCLLHTIMCGIHVPYRLGYKDGVKLNRSDEMRKLRNKMADNLEMIDPATDIPHYYSIGDGALAEFGVSIPEFSLSAVKSTLKSSSYLGNEHIIMISHFLNISIYILEARRQDVYYFDVLPDPTKSSVVALYSEKPMPHYELISIKTSGEPGYITHFAPDHGFIEFLRFRMHALKK